MNWREWGISPGDLLSVSLDASYHKEQEYTCIWFRGGDLNNHRIFGLLLLNGFGVAPWGTPGQCHWMGLIIRNNNIYGLWVGI